MDQPPLEKNQCNYDFVTICKGTWCCAGLAHHCVPQGSLREPGRPTIYFKWVFYVDESVPFEETSHFACTRALVPGTATTSNFQPSIIDKHFTCTGTVLFLAARLALVPGWPQLGFEGPAKKWPRFESDRFAYTRASVLRKVVVLRAREHRFCRPPCRAGLGMGLPQALLAAPRGIPRATPARAKV